MTCECGEPKDAGAEACARCAWLEGGAAPGLRDLVSGLRVLGGEATLPALRDETGMSDRSLFRHLASLRKLGRLVVHRDRDEENQNLATYRLVGDAAEGAR